MIVVVETIRALQGKGKELKEALLRLVPISRKGSGCLQYSVLEPVQGGRELLVLMRWKTLDDLRAHESSDYIEEFVKKYEGALYDEVTSTEWSEVN